MRFWTNRGEKFASVATSWRSFTASSGESDKTGPRKHATVDMTTSQRYVAAAGNETRAQVVGSARTNVLMRRHIAGALAYMGK
jgi:hypothetical protein